MGTLISSGSTVPLVVGGAAGDAVEDKSTGRKGLQQATSVGMIDEIQSRIEGLNPLTSMIAYDIIIVDRNKEAIEMSTQTISGIIMEQLGGRRFYHMAGCKDIVAIENGVQFGFPKSNQGINKVVITLNGMDTYDLKFWRITPKVIKEVVGVGDIYNDQLAAIFTDITGLETHL